LTPNVRRAAPAAFLSAGTEDALQDAYRQWPFLTQPGAHANGATLETWWQWAQALRDLGAARLEQ